MKKLLAVLAVVALVAISFTSCNNGTPAPSTTIPEVMHGTWIDSTGKVTLEISADSFIYKNELYSQDVNYMDATLYSITVSGNSVTFTTTGAIQTDTVFEYADGVITESTDLSSATYTPVNSAE